ncbi:hypothetical protein PBRA_004558, partial [Plasmodiophora brassicae]
MRPVTLGLVIAGGAGAAWAVARYQRAEPVDPIALYGTPAQRQAQRDRLAHDLERLEKAPLKPADHQRGEFPSVGSRQMLFSDLTRRVAFLTDGERAAQRHQAQLMLLRQAGGGQGEKEDRREFDESVALIKRWRADRCATEAFLEAVRGHPPAAAAERAVDISKRFDMPDQSYAQSLLAEAVE